MNECGDILVSIIVPIYNVEKYLSKCIESIIKQSYKKLEILLIDDGSTDSCGSICDKYDKIDDRIKVIHKVNEGVSKARNVGLDNASGKYIIFVDSDDYLSNDFVEYMLFLAEKTQSDFCISKNCYKFVNDKQVENDEINVLTKEEATALLLSQRVDVGCWNKIYNRKLLENNNIRFSADLFYGEGLRFITTVSQLSAHTGVGTKRVYYYRQNNCQSATKKFNYNKYVNGEKSLDIIKESLIVNDEAISKQLNIHYCLFYINAVIDILSNNKKREYYTDYKIWMKKIRNLSKKVLFYKEITNKQRVKILMMDFFPKIISIRNRLCKKKLTKNSID